MSESKELKENQEKLSNLFNNFNQFSSLDFKRSGVNANKENIKVDKEDKTELKKEESSENKTQTLKDILLDNISP